MNGDTSGSRPADDVPFLGPAIPPHDSSGAEPQEADELPPPFIPGTAWRQATEAVEPIAGPEAASVETGADDWPEDDFPWLIGMEPEGEGDATGSAEARVVESLAVEAEFVVAADVEAAAGVAPDSEPVDAAALPIDEWTEDASSVDMVTAPPTNPALIEVAERLERIAASLRSGTVAEAVEEGDPLRLLITGYALGYAQAREGGEG